MPVSNVVEALEAAKDYAEGVREHATEMRGLIADIARAVRRLSETGHEVEKRLGLHDDIRTAALELFEHVHEIEGCIALVKERVDDSLGSPTLSETREATQ
jgi:hypothetical protein